TQLPAPPNVGYTPTLTYDSDGNVLVAWVNDKIYVFDLMTQQWSNQTPAGLPCIFNQVGVYAPTAKVHLFEGGNTCSDGNSAGPTVYAINLNAQTLQGAPLQLSSSSISPQPPISGPAGYTFCATENHTCSFSGQKSVAYGANNNFTFLNLSGGTACTNAVFGDPIFGTVKACYISDVLNQTSTSTHQMPTLPVSPPDTTTGALTAAVALATATTAVTSTQTSTLGPTVTGQLDFPLRTWIARAYTTPNAPGAGGNGRGGGSKHLRLAPNP